jgi:hypothetical protein
MRWLVSFAVVIGLGLLATPTADAQVFKPKSGKTEKKAKPAAKKKSPTKKSAKTKATKKKSAVAERSRPDDLTPEVSSEEPEDSDYVKITDDEDIE